MNNGVQYQAMKGRIIKALQEGIPLNRDPFLILSEEIGIGEDELLDRIKALKEERVIRQLSPIYDTKMLGYDSALVAFKVKPEAIDLVAGVVSSHTGVSHNYERGHEFNLWFTIAIPPDSKLSLDKTVGLLAEKTETLDHIILRSKRVFKIGVRLDPEGSGVERETNEIVNHPFIPLTDEEKQIVRVTQSDMPITKKPFSIYAEMLGMDEDYLLQKLKDFKMRGVMRRFAAILYHRKVGFSANGMAVWSVPEDRVLEVGVRMASFKGVSHCYERETNGRWQYNLFSMIHGRSKDEVEGVVKEISRETGLKDFLIFYSLREFKKERLRYFTF